MIEIIIILYSCIASPPHIKTIEKGNTYAFEIQRKPGKTFCAKRKYVLIPTPWKRVEKDKI